jgi:hypothetical protein
MRMQALQYLRKLCAHPLLVLDGGVQQHVRAVAACAPGAGAPSAWHALGGPLRQLQHAPKLLALRQLLQVWFPGYMACIVKPPCQCNVSAATSAQGLC